MVALHRRDIHFHEAEGMTSRHTRFTGRRAIRSQVSSSISPRYSPTGYSLPHAVQRIATFLQPILSTTSLPQALQVMGTSTHQDTGDRIQEPEARREAVRMPRIFSCLLTSDS